MHGMFVKITNPRKALGLNMSFFIRLITYLYWALSKNNLFMHYNNPNHIFMMLNIENCILLSRFITGYGHSTNRPGHHGTVVARTVGSNASCHTHSLENATHLAGTGVQVLIYMGQMQPASSSIRWSVDARCDSHTDFHLQQKIEYKSCFHGNDYKKVVYLV